MILFNGKNILDNNRYRTRLIYRMNHLSKIIVTTIDLNWSKTCDLYFILFLI